MDGCDRGISEVKTETERWGLGRLDVYGARKGSSEFFRVKGLSKIALSTASNGGLFISLCDCAGAEKNRKFLIERSNQSTEFDSVNFRHPVIK